MKNLFRFISIAVMAVILSSNAAYAQNNTCLAQGESNLNAGKNKEAIAEFTKAIEQNQKLAPADLSKAYINRGIAYRATGETEAANMDFIKAIEIDPTPIDAVAFSNRGLAKSAIGDTQGAKSDFKKAASLGDISATLWLKNNA